MQAARATRRRRGSRSSEEGAGGLSSPWAMAVLGQKLSAQVQPDGVSTHRVFSNGGGNERSFHRGRWSERPTRPRETFHDSS
jgi:hypothetical protein